MATRKKAIKDSEALSLDTPYDIYDILGEVEKIVKIQAVTPGMESRMSTGVLTLDLVFGGGITAGMYTFAGAEQSSKTTFAITTLGNSLHQDVPFKALWDAENSTGASADYVESIFNTQGVKVDSDTVFGVRDKGKWAIRPQIYYQDIGEMDAFFDFLSATLRRMPDKRFSDGKWWYVYEKSKENMSRYGDRADATQSRYYGDLYLPAKDGSLQGLVVCDSYPALVPDALDEDEASKGLAAQAREFSKHLQRVKGKFRRKRFALLGINQLRTKPMVAYGDPFYEPGGDALKYYCMTGDTLLYTEKGLLTALEVSQLKTKQLVGIKGPEPLSAFEYKGHSRIVSLTTDRGFSIRGKPGHAVYALEEGNLEPEFIRLEDFPGRQRTFYVAVKPGTDFWPSSDVKFEYEPHYLDTQPEKIRPCFPDRMSPDLAYLLGLLTGDGYVRRGFIVLSCAEPELSLKYISLFKKLFGLNPKHTRTECRIFDTSLCEFLTYIGQGSKSSWQKEIPWSVRKSSKESQVAFVAGYFDTDGSVSKSGREASFHSVSHTLLRQVQAVLLNANVLANLGGRDNWYAHGNVISEGGVLGSKSVNHRFKAYFLHLYNPELANFGNLVHTYLTLTKKKDRLARAEEICRKTKPARAVLPVHQGGWGKDSTKIVRMILDHTRSSKIYSTDSTWSECIQESIENLRTSHERKKAMRQFEKLAKLFRVTRRNNLVWLKVNDISWSHSEEATFDGNMPKTSTIVTNGIISHNSDARLRFTHRARTGVPSPIGPSKSDDKDTQVEVEESVEGTGKDVYKYIHVKTTKNKLSTNVNRGGVWLRLWAVDHEGNGRGYDPAFDAFNVLYLTEQLTTDAGRKKIMLQVDYSDEVKLVSKKPMTWLEFKTLVLGTKEEKLAIFKKIGVQPFHIRKVLKGQLESGVLWQKYFEFTKKA